MMARDGYAPDMLSTMMNAGDALLNGVTGRTTFYTPEDVRQGAASSDASDDFTRAMADVAGTRASGAVSGMLASDDVVVTPASIITAPLEAVSNFFGRGVFAAVGLVIVAGGLYLFAKDV
jgi:hypothetical protein